MPFGSAGGSQVTSSSVGEPSIVKTSGFRGSDGTAHKRENNKDQQQKICLAKSFTIAN